MRQRSANRPCIRLIEFLVPVHRLQLLHVSAIKNGFLRLLLPGLAQTMLVSRVDVLAGIPIYIECSVVEIGPRLLVVLQRLQIIALVRL